MRLGTITTVRLSSNTNYRWSRWTQDYGTEIRTGRPLLFADEVARLDRYEAIILREGEPPIRARKWGAPAAVPPNLPRLTPQRKTRVLVTINAALIVAAVLWWWWQPATTPVASVQPPPLSMTPMPQPTDAPTPEKPRGRLVLKPWQAPREPKGWGLWQVQTGAGFGAPIGFATMPDSRHPTPEACEAQRQHRIDTMATYLGKQFQAAGHVTMTDLGWREELGHAVGIQSWRETFFVCAFSSPET